MLPKLGTIVTVMSLSVLFTTRHLTRKVTVKDPNTPKSGDVPQAPPLTKELLAVDKY